MKTQSFTVQQETDNMYKFINVESGQNLHIWIEEQNDPIGFIIANSYLFRKVKRYTYTNDILTTVY